MEAATAFADYFFFFHGVVLFCSSFLLGVATIMLSAVRVPQASVSIIGNKSYLGGNLPETQRIVLCSCKTISHFSFYMYFQERELILMLIFI